MAENLFNEAHKTTTPEYRENWDRIFGDKNGGEEVLTKRVPSRLCSCQPGEIRAEVGAELKRRQYRKCLACENGVSSQVGAPAAAGLGDKFDMGAMMSGKSPKEAVEIAMMLDPHTGGEVAGGDGVMDSIDEVLKCHD